MSDFYNVPFADSDLLPVHHYAGHIRGLFGAEESGLLAT